MKNLPSPDDLESIRLLANNQPIEDFCGLSPNEMGQLLYHAFDGNSPLQINSKLSDQVLNQLPFFRLTEEILKIIEREKQIKLTPLGALPKKTLVELYDHHLILDSGIERGIHKLTREIDSDSLSALHYNTSFAGLIRKAKGKLILTKDGTALLKKENRNDLFLRTFRTYTEKLAWSNMDGYPPVPVGNLGWAFTILLLLKFGSTPVEKKFYSEKYVKAFPDFIRHFPEDSYHVPARDLERCYIIRSFDRFLHWWGLVEIIEDRGSFEREHSKVVASPILREIFSLSE